MAVPLLNPFASFFSGLIAPVTNLFAARNENQTAVKMQQVQRIINADDKLAELERIDAENAGASWKDEFWTLVLALPAIMAFIPAMVPHVTAGFDALASMPEFYRWWLSIAIGTSFGIRTFRK